MCREFNLRTSVARSSKRIDNGRTKVASQLASLIETAAVLAPPVEWNRHDAVRIFEQVRAADPHLICDANGKRAPARVLQGVDNLPQRAVVLPNCA
jgi:hypothetical protein